jgi:hypothetical protein
MLRQLQADANRREAPETLTYIDINKSLNGAAPAIDSTGFEELFNNDPELAKYVDGYDQIGLRLKTTAPQQPDNAVDMQEPKADLSGIAKSTAKRRLNK